MKPPFHRNLVMLALAGWFFVARGETNYPGVILTQEFEGFSNRATCESARQKYEDFLTEMGMEGVKVSPKCQEKVRS